MWLFISFCYENPLSQIAILHGMMSVFLPKFQEMWPIGISLVDAPTKLLCLVRWFVFTFMLQNFYKLKQLGSTCIAFKCYGSRFYNQSLQPLL